MNIAVAGSHGLIGNNLVTFFRKSNNNVSRIVRAKEQNGIFWDPHTGYINHEKLENYDAEFQVWIDDEGCYWSYYFMNTLKKEHQKRPEKSILTYNGSSNTKNVPPPELHDAMINSSKPIRIVIHDWNEEGIGYFEQYHIVKHMLLDEKNGTKTLFNKHAEGPISLGFLPSRDLMKSTWMRYKELILLRGQLEDYVLFAMTKIISLAIGIGIGYYYL